MKPLELSVTRGRSSQKGPDLWERTEFTVKVGLDPEDDLDAVQRSVSSRVESWLPGGPEEGPPQPPPLERNDEAGASPIWRAQRDGYEWALVQELPTVLREQLKLAGAKASDETYSYRSWKTADGGLRVTRYPHRRK